jgi:general secretion pathway protein K
MSLSRAQQRARRRRNERGIALIMVLGAIVVLAIMLAEFQEDTTSELVAARADAESVQAEYYARSAINLSRLLISTEPAIRQTITPLFAMMKATPPQLPVWDFSDRLLGAFNDDDGAQDFASLGGLDMTQAKNTGLQGGKFEIVIVDEDAKINLNMGASNDIAHIRLAKELMSQMLPLQYNPIFEHKDERGNYHDRLTICSALIDWADVDEQIFSCDFTNQQATSSGVEDAWYQLLPDHPYRRKNAPYDSLEELHVVRGISDEFWATFVDPDPSKPKKRQWTVWGQGTVNVNSANAATLLAIVCSGAPQAELCNDPLQMNMFLTGVMMAQSITLGAPLFGKPADFINTMKGSGQLGPMLTALGMKPVKFQSESEFAKTISTESKIFSIYAVGVKGKKRETRVSIHVVVDFRTAPQIPNGLAGSLGAPSASGSASGAPPPPPPPTATGGQQVNPPGMDPNALAASLLPSTGGQILYYKIE